MFTITVDRDIQAAHHNGPPSSKCWTNHGHTWKVQVAISGGRAELNEWGWLVDFRAIKETIDAFDHSDLNEHHAFECYPSNKVFGETGETPPPLRPSAENLAEIIFWNIVEACDKMPDWVSVQEGTAAMVRYTPALDDVDPRRIG